MRIWHSVVLVLVVATAAAAAYRWRSGGLTVRCVTVETGDIREYIDERGKTRLRHIYNITMPFAGRIEPIGLREGDAVKAGEVVARINRNDLVTEMDQATAVVERLQAAIAEKQDHSVEHRGKTRHVSSSNRWNTRWPQRQPEKRPV